MARVVARTRVEPKMYVIDGEETWFCQCGLSRNQPYCDGSHKMTNEEHPNKLYWYDAEGKRHEVTEKLDGIRKW